jgi:hypothetical protein
MSDLIIACGALAREVITIRNKYGWDAQVLAVPAILHNRPEQIPAAVQKRIQESRQDHARVIVVYGECGTQGALDLLIHDEDAVRVSGPHCYEQYAGDSFELLMSEEPGTFFLTDFLAHAFEYYVVKGLGLDDHPELMEDYFGEYTRVVYLQQRVDPNLVKSAEKAAAFLNLPLQIHPTGFGALEDRLVEIIEGSVTHNPFIDLEMQELPSYGNNL